MKLIALAFALLHFAANAQKPIAYIQAKGDNIIYSGIEHYIEVISTVKVDSVTVSKGTIKSAGTPTKFFVLVKETYGTACIVKAWGQGKVIVQKEYRTQNIPLPTGFYVGRKNGEKISVAHAKAGLGINLILENFGFDFKINVKAFTIVRIGIDGTRDEAENLGPAFSTAAKAIVQKAQPGDYFLFKGIAAIMPDGREVGINAFFIEITE